MISFDTQFHYSSTQPLIKAVITKDL